MTCFMCNQLGLELGIIIHIVAELAWCKLDGITDSIFQTLTGEKIDVDCYNL